MTGVTAVMAVSAHGPTAPSFRVRTQIPREELARHGIALRSLPLFTADEAAGFRTGSSARRAVLIIRARRRQTARLAAIGEEVETAVVQRQADLLPSRRLERLASRGRRLVLDVDDAIWHDQHPSAHGHALAFLKDSRRKVSWLASTAETVVAGNDILAEWLARHSDRVVVIPSLVDPANVPVRTHADGPAIAWGWIGSPATAPHLHALGPWLEEAAREVPQEVELLVVGAEAPRVRGVRVTAIPWSEASEAEALRRMDVGLMPLPDDEWTRGKCAYKALQYMAAGAPVVADDVGVSARVIGHESGGLIARGRREWIDALARLSRDPALRSRLGAHGRARVEEDYSVTRWGGLLAAVLTGRPQ